MRTILACTAAVLLPAAALAQAIQPGMWETQSTTTMANMPDLPPAIAARLKNHTVTVRHCVTPEEAAQGPKHAIAQQKSCAIDHYTMSGGRFDAKMTCSGTIVSSTGSYTPTSMTGDSHVTSARAGGMDMTAHIISQRVGPC